MDPIAKRFMWEVISRLSTRRGKTAVILTTHSMNEAQALCTRIGIMVLNIVLTLTTCIRKAVSVIFFSSYSLCIPRLEAVYGVLVVRST